MMSKVLDTQVCDNEATESCEVMVHTSSIRMVKQSLQHVAIVATPYLYTHTLMYLVYTPAQF